MSEFGPKEQALTCPHCHHFITTHVKSQPTRKSRCLTLVRCIFCCWLCCKSSYWWEACRDRYHYCPECNAFLGVYHS